MSAFVVEVFSQQLKSFPSRVGIISCTAVLRGQEGSLNHVVEVQYLLLCPPPLFFLEVDRNRGRGKGVIASDICSHNDVICTSHKI